MERYGIDKGELRFFVHYQPTYCALSLSHPSPETGNLSLTLIKPADHFHVHIVRASPRRLPASF